MSPNSRRGPKLGVGGSSILVIFVILTLATFATLSLASASADYNLSKKNITAATEYYAADSKAEEILGEIDLALKKIPPGEKYFADCEAVLDTIDGVEAYRDDSGALFAGYAVQVSEIQTLIVEIEIQDIPEQRFVRRQWAVAVQAESDEENTLTLWEGDVSV